MQLKKKSCSRDEHVDGLRLLWPTVRKEMNTRTTNISDSFYPIDFVTGYRSPTPLNSSTLPWGEPGPELDRNTAGNSCCVSDHYNRTSATFLLEVCHFVPRHTLRIITQDCASCHQYHVISW